MLKWTEECIICIFCLFCNVHAFHLRMDNIWLCKQCKATSSFQNLYKEKTDAEMVHHDGANVSVLEEYKCRRGLGQILHFLHFFLNICYLLSYA